MRGVRWGGRIKEKEGRKGENKSQSGREGVRGEGGEETKIGEKSKTKEGEKKNGKEGEKRRKIRKKEKGREGNEGVSHSEQTRKAKNPELHYKR